MLVFPQWFFCAVGISGAFKNYGRLALPLEALVASRAPCRKTMIVSPQWDCRVGGISGAVDKKQKG
jgi:hypothetical protein